MPMWHHYLASYTTNMLPGAMQNAYKALCGQVICSMYLLPGYLPTLHAPIGCIVVPILWNELPPDSLQPLKGPGSLDYMLVFSLDDGALAHHYITLYFQYSCFVEIGQPYTYIKFKTFGWNILCEYRIANRSLNMVKQCMKEVNHAQGYVKCMVYGSILAMEF